MDSHRKSAFFSVIDIEATGIYPTAHDRVIELAVVRLNSSLEIEDEYVTLLNPERDIGRTDIHGICSADVLNAPTFTQIAGDVAERIGGTIMAGHNLRFDLGFLNAEYTRLGISVPALPTICTLELAYKIFPEAPSRKLAACCEAAGIQHENEHSALGDARATACLLIHYLKTSRIHRDSYAKTLESLRTWTASKDWLSLRPSGLSLTRQVSARQTAQERAYLARLVERTLGDEAASACEADYLTLLDRALEDRVVTKDEADNLINIALSWGMSRSEVLNAHRGYLATLVSEALVDGSVAPIERRDLENICDMLDLNRATLDELLSAPRHHSKQANDSLAGMTVCFTGELVGQIDGIRITRDIAESLAGNAGLLIQSSVTKNLDILVVADPNTQSGKARKARDYGVRIIAEPVFWRAIRADVQ